MNKLMWKLYLNSIINTHNSEPIGYPDNNRETYVFKLTKNFKDNLTICPRIGLTNIDNLKIFFDEYRIVALNAIVKNGEHCKNNKLEFVNDHTYKNGDFKITYYPNNPRIEYNDTFNESRDTYWLFRNCENISIAIVYEVIPKYPMITMPTSRKYTNIEGFKEEYVLLDKNKSNVIVNDIAEDIIDENISIEEFLKIFN